MKHLVYVHGQLRPLIAVSLEWVHGQVTHWLSPLAGRLSLTRRRLIVMKWVAVALTLVIQAVMLFMLAELVDLCISLMEVWAELASHHIAMTGHE